MVNPGTPAEAGVSEDMIRAFAGVVPVLGVCLGHQALVEVYGGSITRAERLMHGKASQVLHTGTGLYAGLPNPFAAGRYHSLVVSERTLPAELEVTARTREDGLVMGLRHRALPIHGVQFHPESVLTNEGRRILRTFLEM